MENELNKELTNLLAQEGCKIFGFADLSILPNEPRKGLAVGIILGEPYTGEGMQANLDGDIRKFSNASGATFEPLERYQKTVAQFLKAKKYKANTTYKKMECSGGITYKMLGTLGGIGWIGRNALLTTKEYGAALRLEAVLTNAPFECAEPITKSLCPPNCAACADICHANAIKGGLWERGIHRDTFFDVKACRKGRKIRDKVSQGEPLCGLCISACPLTKKGLLESPSKTL